MFRKLAPALAAPLLLVSACASQADDGAVAVQTGPAAAAALRAAPDAAAAAGTAAFEMEVSVTSAVDEAFEVVATGAFDTDAQQMAMEVDLGTVLAGLAGSAGDAVAPGMDEPFRFVVDGTTIYLRVPLLDALTGTSGWLSATPDDLGAGAGSLALGTGSYDPSTFLEVLRGVADDVEARGREDVRGVPTTRYTASVNLTRALDQAPVAQREELEAQLDQLGTSDAALQVEAWVDADGLVRRIIMAFDGLVDTAGLGDDATMEIAIELFDYGEPVEIDVPPPEDVTPFTEVMGTLGGAFGTAGS